MAWLRPALLSLAAAALPVVGAASPPEGCTPPSDDLVAELLDWVAARSDYSLAVTRSDPPEIVFCTEGDTLAYDNATTLVEPHERGIYDWRARRIWLVAPWSPERPRDVAVLLHELVHDIQFANRTWECPQAAEWEAYQLSEDWLLEHGVEPDYDWLRIYFWSRCPRNPHP